MTDQRLIDYIKQSQDRGFSEEQIRETLLKAYWVPDEIDKAFAEINKSKSALEKQINSGQKEKSSVLSKISFFGSKKKRLDIKEGKPNFGLDAYFGRKPIFGLDISDYSVEAVQLRPKRGIIKLDGLGRIILKPNIIKDGNILQREELAKSIINLLTNIKFGKIRTNDVICSIPESQVFSHVFRFPATLKKEQIYQSLKFEAEGIIPIPLTDTYYDFVETPSLGDDPEDAKKEKEIFFAAARKKTVRDYYLVLRSAGLRLLALENETLSLTRSLFRINRMNLSKAKKGVPVPLRGVVILDIGARTTNLSIVDQKGIRLAVNVAIAGDKFNETIAKGLGISLLEADQLKREYGLNKNVREGKIYSSLTPLFSDIFSEIKKAISYYEIEKRGKITKLLLAGGSAQMPGLIDHFHENLSEPINVNKSLSEKIEIKVGNPWAGIELDASVAPKYLKENIESVLDNIKIALARRSILYATAIGVALRGTVKDPKKESINFLPDNIEKESQL